jgi:hypothetical protein
MNISFKHYWKYIVPLTAAVICIPFKLYASDSTKLNVGIIVVLLALFGLIPHLRTAASYNPLQHYDPQIYTRPRPQLLVVICNIIAGLAGLTLLCSNSISQTIH